MKKIKPNADIYEHLLKEYSLCADECVFIDDREENIGTARKLGMKGIVFVSYEQACEELFGLIFFTKPEITFPSTLSRNGKFPHSV